MDLGAGGFLYRFLLPPFHKNLGKRIIKSPKIYFYRYGTRFLSDGDSNQTVVENGPLYGALFENYVVPRRLKSWYTRGQMQKCFSSEKATVTKSISSSTGNQAGSILKSNQDTHSALKWRDSFFNVPKMRKRSLVVYRGKEFPLGDGVSVINFKSFLDTNKV